MLKYDINKDSQTGVKYDRLNPETMKYSGDSIEFLCKGHGLKDNDTVYFNRIVENLSLYEEKTPNVIDNDRFLVGMFTDYNIYPSNVEIVNNFQMLEGRDIIEKPVLAIDLSNPTWFVTPKNFYIDTFIEDIEKYYDGTSTVNSCVGDNVLYNGFVYHVDELYEDGTYKFNMDNIANPQIVSVYYYDEKGNVVTLNGGYVIYYTDGEQDLYRLVFILDQESLDNYIYLDDFPQRIADEEYDGDMTAFKQYYIDNIEKTNSYHLLPDMFPFDGIEYYAWELLSGEDDGNVTYLLTDTTDFSGLTLEDDINADHCPFVYILNSDGNVYATSQDYSQNVIVAQKYEDNTNRFACEYIAENWQTLDIFAKDERFIKENEIGELYFSGLDNGDTNSPIFKRMGDYRLTIPIGEMVSSNLNVLDTINNGLIDYIEERNTPDIVDYEKMMFTPVYCNTEDVYGTDDDKFGDVSEIEFNLHFRDRTDENGNNTEEWVTTESNAWNNYYITQGEDERPIVKSVYTGLTDSDADSLGYLNFTDYDVFYQTNKLRKSFIRLSFYDSKDRANQILQFYSTIFFDSGRAYKDMLELSGGKLIDLSKDEYVFDEGDPLKLRLKAQFLSYPRTDYEHSSDGFYLYLFPTLLNGTTVSELYMKVEFNHAGYGRTIPMTMPVYEDESGICTPIPSEGLVVGSERHEFPAHYMKERETEIEGQTEYIYDGIEYQKLLNDMYIKVLIKYDKEKNRYVWYLPNKSDNGKMVFNLFEARMNSYEQKVGDTIIPEEI